MFSLHEPCQVFPTIGQCSIMVADAILDYYSRNLDLW